MSLDLYRSNDHVQFDRSSLYLRPFVKVGDESNDVQVVRFEVPPLPDASGLFGPQEIHL